MVSFLKKLIKQEKKILAFISYEKWSEIGQIKECENYIEISKKTF